MTQPYSPLGGQGISDWSATRNYSVGDYVVSGGAIWRALAANANVAPTAGATWTSAVGAVAGPTGAAGPTGPTGGAAGATGATGSAGATGAAGATGVVASIVPGTNVTVDATDPANPIVSASGGGGSPPFDLAGGDTFTATASGPGDYTLAKSGIVVKNGDGDEICRIWATDPDSNNFNSENLYVGWKTGLAQPTDNISAGYQNTAIGSGSFLSITEGGRNTVVGCNSMIGLTTGGTNVAVGYNSMNSVVDGVSNIGVGSGSLASVVSGDYNIGIGDGANSSVVSADYNVCVGAGAAPSLVDGDGNTVIGDNAGSGITHGEYNIFIGNLAGAGGDHTNSIAIGKSAQSTASNQIVIGNGSSTDAYFGDAGSGGTANSHQKAVFITAVAAPADGSLSANQVALWFDPTNGAAKLMIKGKSADGTVVTGEVALT